MAPEQGLEGQCDIRSDIYSLGIVLYEMLLGEPPFDAETPLAILMKHVNDPLPPPRKRDPTLPKQLERVVLKALSKRREARFQSAGEMAEALHKAATRAGIEPPSRISLPMYLTQAEASSESVAVLSGTARERVRDAEFVSEDTDMELGKKLAAASVAMGVGASLVADASPGQAEESVEEPVQLPEDEPVAKKKGRTSRKAARASRKEALARRREQLAASVEPVKRSGVGRAILNGIMIVAFGNLAVVFLGLLTNWWGVFSHGWPFELLLVGWALCLIMEASGSVWMFIPTGIILGNGILFAFYSITGLWSWWAFLWPLEPMLVGGSIWYAIWLSGRGEQGRRIARQLGRSLKRVAVVLTPIVVILGAIAG
jgi:hypothetical protein